MVFITNVHGSSSSNKRDALVALSADRSSRDRRDRFRGGEESRKDDDDDDGIEEGTTRLLGLLRSLFVSSCV